MSWVERHGRGWRVRYTVTGGRVVTDSTHPAPAAAVLRSKQVDCARALNTPLHASCHGPTLAQWVDLWQYSHRVGPATSARYASFLRNHLLPRFGDTPIDAITRQAVKAYITDLRATYSQQTVASIVGLLALILREAVDDRRIPVDVCRRLRLVTGPHPQRPWATPAQVVQIINRMSRFADQVLVVAAAYTGMRWGELTGLSRTRVDLDTGVLTIDPEVGCLHEVRGQLWLGPPKTPDSARPVTMPDFLTVLIGLLLTHHQHDLVFTAPEEGFWRRSNFTRRIWRPAIDGDPTRDLPPIIPGLHFHDLRHSHKTWMINDGIPEIAQELRLGHHVPGSRGVYSHTTADIEQRLLVALTKRWEASQNHGPRRRRVARVTSSGSRKRSYRPLVD
jgi:integrase